MPLRILFYGLASFVLATAGYYLLWAVMPGHYVFGSGLRMLPYHTAHPLAYIALACGCFGPLAAAATGTWRRRARPGRVALVLLLALGTVALASPLGGMLWYWHDMRAGFFPPDWQATLLSDGPRDGLLLGWLIVGLSIPYNALGLLVCYCLLSAGARVFESEIKS